MDQAQHGAIGSQPADAGAEGDDPHVLDARIGQQPFVLGLFENKGGGHQDGDETQYDQNGARKIPEAGSVHDFIGFEYSQVGAVEQYARQQG